MAFFFAFFAVFLALPVLWPRIDLAVSSHFYRAGQGFYLADALPFVALHWLAYDGARALGVICVVGAVIGFVTKRAFTFIPAKGWLFVFLALVIGPGLIANAGLKDHWGRYRPREVTEFGGAQQFTPALEPHFENAHSNGSFVAGDPAFGFFLPAFAYVAPRRRARQLFWGGLGAGLLFSVTRIAQGGHFFGDCVYAAAVMLATTAILHAVMYGRDQTKALWRSWFSLTAV
jgi:lipid A 4'-phosphatase